MIWVLLILTAVSVAFYLYGPLWVGESTTGSRPMIGLLAALYMGSIIGIYALNGQPELTGEMPEVQRVPDNAPGNSQDAASLVASLKNRLIETGSTDPEGWHLLARSQMKIGQYDEAIISYEKLVEIAPENTVFADEFAKAQAFINRQTIASQTTPEEQQAMIQNMVSGLADRLYSDGGTPEEWARLLRARQVLGQTKARAKDIEHIKTQFKDQPELLDKLLGSKP